MVQKVKFLEDLKDRFLKWETVHGLYMIPLGVIGLWVILVHIEFILHVLGVLVFLYAVIEGLYKFFHNPIKRRAHMDEAAKKYTPPGGTP